MSALKQHLTPGPFSVGSAPEVCDETPASEDPRPGEVLGGCYQIEARIGQGAAAGVYRAVHLKLNRRVAVKILRAEAIADEAAQPRLRQEALTLAALSHPNIVSLTDCGIFGNKPFLVMEFIEGSSLRDVLSREGALAPERAVKLAKQVLQALAYAHELGIVHRDIKPANLQVQRLLPAVEHLKVLDFGIIKILRGSSVERGVGPSHARAPTPRGWTLGTPLYMSPEQAAGEELDGRSDLYSVGVVLFEMLTGGRPFEGKHHAQLFGQHLVAKVPRLLSRRTELAAYPALQTIIDRALAKRRDDRFASAAEFLSALDCAFDVRSDAGRTDATPAPSTSAVATSTLDAATPALSGSPPVSAPENGSASEEPPDNVMDDLAVSYQDGSLTPPGSFARGADHVRPVLGARTISLLLSSILLGSVLGWATGLGQQKAPAEVVSSPTPAPRLFKVATSSPRAPELRAERLPQRDLALDARRAEELADEGRARLRAGRAADAATRYRSALRLVPNYPRALAGLAAASIALGKGQSAVRYARALTRTRPRLSAHLRLLGDAYESAGDIAAARRAWARAAKQGDAQAEQKLRGGVLECRGNASGDPW